MPSATVIEFETIMPVSAGGHSVEAAEAFVAALPPAFGHVELTDCGRRCAGTTVEFVVPNPDGGADAEAVAAVEAAAIEAVTDVFPTARHRRTTTRDNAQGDRAFPHADRAGGR